MVSRSARLKRFLTTIHHQPLSTTPQTVPLGFWPPNTTLAPAAPTRSSGPNQPFGIAFIGTAFSEFGLIELAYPYEQATHNRLKQLAFPEAIPKTQLVDIIGH